MRDGTKVRGALGASLLWLAVAGLPGCASPPHAVRTTSAGVRPVLWHDPGRIASLDLSWSDRGRFKRPVAPFSFVKEDMSGTRAKVHVKDADGVSWNVKLAGDADDTAEVHAEVAAERIVWALGYFVERGYYVGGGTIEHVGPLKRAARGLTADGRFRAARFKERPRSSGDDAHWTFGENPFVGTRELSGLMILVTMINDWDLTRDNLAVLRADDSPTEVHYLIADLGATFGHMKNVRFPYSLLSLHNWSNWNERDYERQGFIERVHDGRVRLHFRGEITMPDIPMEHARWFAGLARQLTPRQVQQAFEAAGATPGEVTGFSTRFLEKVRELERAVSES